MNSFVVFLFCLIPSLSFALPAQIVLMRHAEKPVDENDVNLSPEGYAHAEKIPSLFGVDSVYMQFGRPAGIVAAQTVAGKHSARCVQTVTPLAKYFSQNVLSPYSAEDFVNAANWIKSNSEFDGKTVVVAWTHGYIVEFAKALGSAPSDKWSSQTFDKIWLIKFDNNGNASSTELDENL